MNNMELNEQEVMLARVLLEGVLDGEYSQTTKAIAQGLISKLDQYADNSL